MERLKGWTRMRVGDFIITAQQDAQGFLRVNVRAMSAKRVIDVEHPWRDQGGCAPRDRKVFTTNETIIGYECDWEHFCGEDGRINRGPMEKALQDPIFRAWLTMTRNLGGRTPEEELDRHEASRRADAETGCAGAILASLKTTETEE
ncbi:MAG: hypothetical protein WC728_14480 [Elusimicrobiota bacterium]